MDWYYSIKVCDRETGLALEGVSVSWPEDSILSLNGNHIAERQVVTDYDGTVVLKVEDGDPDVITVTVGGSTIDGIEYKSRTFEVIKTPNYDHFTEVEIQRVDSDQEEPEMPVVEVPLHPGPGVKPQNPVDNKDDKKKKKVVKYIIIGAAVIVLALIAMLIW